MSDNKRTKQTNKASKASDARSKGSKGAPTSKGSKKTTPTKGSKKTTPAKGSTTIKAKQRKVVPLAREEAISTLSRPDLVHGVASFLIADKNGDNRIDREELTAFLSYYLLMDSEPVNEIADALFESDDTIDVEAFCELNSRLTGDEDIKDTDEDDVNLFRSALAAFDSNGDGKIDQDEFVQAVPAILDIERLIRQLERMGVRKKDLAATRKAYKPAGLRSTMKTFIKDFRKNVPQKERAALPKDALRMGEFLFYLQLLLIGVQMVGSLATDSTSDSAPVSAPSSEASSGSAASSSEAKSYSSSSSSASTS